MCIRDDHLRRLKSLILLLLILSLSLAACTPAPEQGLLEVTSEFPRNTIEQGHDFDIILTMRNTSAYNARVKELRLPGEFMKQVKYMGSNPGLTMTTNSNGDGIIAMDLSIAPEGSHSVLFRFNSMAQGTISGIGLVSTDLGGYQFEMKATVDGANPSGWQPQVSPTQGPDAPSLGAIPYQAVVQIKAMVQKDGEIQVGWTGSGTIISRDGLILTNAHVVLSDRYYQVEDLVVALTLSQDSPPVDTYFAGVVQADEQLDMAVIKVRSDLQGRALDYASLNLPAVPLGDSDSLELGDTITILGYPGIGGETITLTRGEVSGFTAQEPYGNRAYIKTNATIAGGNSGGLAVDGQGRLIGVPTKLGSGDDATDLVDCRPLFDTNRDGYVDENDNCLPTGGFINALRPMRLAQDLVRAAQAGQVAIVPQTPQQQIFSPNGRVIFSDDFSNPNSGWIDSRSEAGNTLYAEGGYVIEVLRTSYGIWDSVDYVYDDIVLSVDAEVLQGAGDGDYGLVCGEIGDDFYALQITEDGYYSIWKQKAENIIYLADWAYSERAATGKSHQIQAYCGRSRLILAVDGITLAEASDPEFRPGLVGVIAGTYQNAPLRVRFDNFSIIQNQE